ncbi:hypothetical protein BV22DRAFT_708482 [Leucogyrophana mollusca]|uniref:Uncharacterized protein n=1 Tax=Leucogyrophana mollusca TaxID=85980 RepID=A0ACB8B7M9_9AGAM|nr:hypothetical protein BV22DRAFT_708482 [Leucogyrophana mollusca]
MMSNDGPTFSAQGKKKALLIGIRYTLKKNKKFPPIHAAHEDTISLKKLLIDVYGYAEADITVMLDDRTSLNEAGGTGDLTPIKNNIIKQIQLLVKGAAPNDQFFFYYSGHGKQVPCKHHSEPDGMEEAICTCDAKTIVDNALKYYLVEPLPKGSRLFALFDCCHSETVLDLEHHMCNRGYFPPRQRCESAPGQAIFSGLANSSKALYRNLNTLGSKNSASASAQEKQRGKVHGRSFIALNTNVPATVPDRWITSPTVQRVFSPFSYFVCTGCCAMPEPEERDTRAYVISLSACKDNESAYDDERGGTMTKFFIAFLRKNSRPTLRALLEGVREEVNKVSQRRRDQPLKSPKTTMNGRPYAPRRQATEVLDGTRSDRVRGATRHIKQNVNNALNQSLSQEPRFASHYRLDLDELLEL